MSTREACRAAAAESSLIARWNSYIDRAAARAVRAIGLAAAHAEDVAQEARLKVALTARAGRLEPAYVKVVIDNAVRDQLRRLRAGLREGSGRLMPLDAAPGPLVDLSPDVLAVRRWFLKLPEPAARLFELLYVEDLSEREAAPRAGMSRPTLRNRHRALIEDARRALAA